MQDREDRGQKDRRRRVAGRRVSAGGTGGVGFRSSLKEVRPGECSPEDVAGGSDFYVPYFSGSGNFRLV